MSLKQKEHQFTIELELEILRRLSNFVNKHFAYKLEEKDYWESYKEIIAKDGKRIDCDEFATYIFSRAYDKFNIKSIRLGILNRWDDKKGLQAHMIVLYYGMSKSNPYVIPTTRIIAYKPIKLSEMYASTNWKLTVSFNKEKTWTHRIRRKNNV